MKSNLVNSNLSLRSGEEFYLQTNRPKSAEEYERVYIVAQIETPPLPEVDKNQIHQEHQNIAIIAAEVYSTISSEGEYLVGWVHMGYDTKVCIGEELLELKAKNGEWFYMVLDTRKHQ